MELLTGRMRQEREYRGVLETLSAQLKALHPRPMQITGLCEGAKITFVAALIRDIRAMCGRGPLILVQDEREAQRLAQGLENFGFFPKMYPYRDFIFHPVVASHEYEQERLSVLSCVLSGEYDAVIAASDAALQFTMPQAVLSSLTREIRKDTSCDMEELIQFLLSSGYVRTEPVDGPGQFAVRGGILDIYPPQSDAPVRMELFGDEIDQMGFFDILTQRKTESCERFFITPAREIVMTADMRRRLAEVVGTLQKRAPDERTRAIFAAELLEIETGGELTFADKYISFLYPQKECLLHYFSPQVPYLVLESGGVLEHAESAEWREKQNIETLLEERAISAQLAQYAVWKSDFEEWMQNRTGVIADTFAGSCGNLTLSGLFSMVTRQTVSYADSFELLTEDLRAYLNTGFSAVVLCENDVMAKNIQAMLSEKENIFASVVHADETEAVGNVPLILSGVCIPGFEFSASRFAVLSLFAARSTGGRIRSASRKRKSRKTAQERIMSYADLTPGDYVVHDVHGIGIYQGLQTVTVDGITRDYVKIKYAGKDMLYLPCNQLDAISKYIGAGAEEGTLKLSHMGGTEWGRTKARARAATKEMAKELIALYAERQRKEGFAFDRDDEMQTAFEQSFAYEETEGQLIAVNEIKQDMESRRPMERLLCGDVGFGKTEVALRAAFKAVQSGKQVAVLVPTTILAMQHYQTFLARMRGFPVNVGMVSRFRSPKQQAETLRKLRRGEVDILIGTHRILSKDVEFHDLGLVIVDEEQRFGVSAKEKLKQMTKNVDVLTLTATPIPRTLNMAMSGIRDMSILEEAPGDRLPVQTYVLEYDEMIIADAIRKELHRGGQVFYLHNRVDTLDTVAAKVRQMAPEARIAVAHGQMDREELSDIWRSMIDGDTDILISTTIIESGVDVPNANTLIVENAERLGLSQLHQIRGRVGRSSRRAYAYFTYPKGMVLSDIAQKRLSAMREYTEFGSGFRIALRDLEIRGAGNLLGAEQHGYIESVGYDLYMRLLNEAVLEEKGEKPKPKAECTVDLNINAYIPESYIQSTAQRIEAYKKIAMIENDADFGDIVDEMLDRYGNVPQVVSDLIQISYIRQLAGMAGMAKIENKGSSILIYPLQMRADIWSSLAAVYPGKLFVNMSVSPYIAYRFRKNDFPLDFLIELFKKYIQIQRESM